MAFALPQRDEDPLERDGDEPIFFDRDVQADSCPVMLPESLLEGSQRRFVRPAADGDDLLAHGPSKREGTLADDEMTGAIAQLKPKQAVSGERCHSAQAASESRAEMVEIQRERGHQSKMPSVVGGNSHAHRARDRYLLVKKLLCLLKLLGVTHEAKISYPCDAAQSALQQPPR